MGYRSTAILAVSKDARPHLMHFLSQHPEAMNMCFGKHADRTENFQGEEGAIMVRFDGIKWYDSFPAIQAIMSFMDHMESEEIEYGPDRELADGHDAFRFVRTGEEYDDIEQRGWAFDVYPSVGIEY